MEFEFNANENLIEVIAKKKGSIFNWFGVNGIALRFEVKVPNRFNNEVHTSGGDIKISDISGINTFKTSGGDVWVKKIEGNLKYQHQEEISSLNIGEKTREWNYQLLAAIFI
jgi:hypothetical protein